MIRQAVYEDLNEIFDLVKDVGNIHYQNRKDLFLPEAITISKQKLKDRIYGEKYHILVKTDGCEIAGVIMAYIRTIKDDIKYLDAKVLRIEELVVKQKYRKQGIASELLTKMKAYAEESQCSRLEINVWSFNIPCLSLVKKFGFSKQQETLEIDCCFDLNLRQKEIYSETNIEKKRYTIHYKKIEYDNILAHIQNSAQLNAKILDCAAGCGNIAFELKRKGYNIVASDLSCENVSFIKAECKRKKIKIPVFNDNALNLSRHKDNMFDIVLCMGPIYHMNKQSVIQCLTECRRVVKEGGYIFITYLNKNYWGPYILTHKYPEYTLDEILSMIQCGFFIKNKKDFCSSAFYFSPDEIEKLVLSINDFEIYKHITIDGNWGIAFEKINMMDLEEIDKLKRYIYQHSSIKEQVYSGKNNMIIIKKGIVKS